MNFGTKKQAWSQTTTANDIRSKECCDPESIDSPVEKKSAFSVMNGIVSQEKRGFAQKVTADKKNTMVINYTVMGDRVESVGNN